MTDETVALPVRDLQFNKIPMCWVPFHSTQPTIGTLFLTSLLPITY